PRKSVNTPHIHSRLFIIKSYIFVFFFFSGRGRHTRFSRDWSSDVCSSDLLPRWRILLTLHECGQCSQKLLAERCRLDPASLTRLLQAMQQQGWVTRSADPHDNRVTNAA